MRPSCRVKGRWRGTVHPIPGCVRGIFHSFLWTMCYWQRWARGHWVTRKTRGLLSGTIPMHFSNFSLLHLVISAYIVKEGRTQGADSSSQLPCAAGLHTHCYCASRARGKQQHFQYPLTSSSVISPHGFLKISRVLNWSWAHNPVPFSLGYPSSHTLRDTLILSEAGTRPFLFSQPMPSVALAIQGKVFLAPLPTCTMLATI